MEKYNILMEENLMIPNYPYFETINVEEYKQIGSIKDCQKLFYEKTRKRILNLADYYNLSVNDFIKKYFVRVYNDIYLTSKKEWNAYSHLFYILDADKRNRSESISIDWIIF